MTDADEHEKTPSLSGMVLTVFMWGCTIHVVAPHRRESLHSVHVCAFMTPNANVPLRRFFMSSSPI
jgi:hypothetical protein